MVKNLPFGVAMKKLTVQTILMYAVYTAFVLLSQTLVGGALAFGMFVGALYSANPLSFTSLRLFWAEVNA